VEVSTIQNWVDQHRDFFLAIRSGMEEYDTNRVHKALVNRACGYDYEEVDIEEVMVKAPVNGNGDGVPKRTNGNGNGNGNGKGTKYTLQPGVKITTRKKHVLGSPQCMFFYLVNRQPHRWKHMMQLMKMEIEGNVNSTNHNIDWSEMTKALGVKGLKQLRDILQPIQQQQLESAGSGKSSGGDIGR
jgi:hypothetical protein